MRLTTLSLFMTVIFFSAQPLAQDKSLQDQLQDVKAKIEQMENENQQLKQGLSFVEIVSNCPSGWKMTPIQSNKWMEENMLPFYPLGDIKVDGKLVS